MTIVLAICAFLALSILGLALLYVVLIIIRGCIRIFLPRGWFAPLSGRAIILSAGATAVIFWDTTDQLVKGFFGLFLDSLGAFVAALSRYVELAGTSNLDEGVMEAVQQELYRGFPILLDSAENLLFGTSYPAVLAALAVFFLLANSLSAPQTGSNDNALLLRIARWYRDLETLRKNRINLSVAVILGAYLSLAAVLSVPWLYDIDEPNPQEEILFRARLESSAEPRDEWNTKWSEVLFTDDPLAQLNALLSNQEAINELKARLIKELAATFAQPADGNTAEQETLPKVRDFDAYVAAAKAGTEQIHKQMVDLGSQWKMIKASAEESRTKAFEAAITAYQNYRENNLSDRERQRFRDDLTNWYTARVASIDEYLRRFLVGVRWRESDWQRWAVEARSDLERGAVEYSRQPYLDIGISIEEVTFDKRPPPSPVDPSEIGIFGFFSQWLISTKSYSVALLFGMIGFGLVGSGVSRALSPLRRDQPELASRGTLDVVLVGVSASIIIFLASQGGLAIFASGETQPNGYILFLSALLGAAYGDRVWEAARERFFEQLSKGTQGDGGGTGHGDNGDSNGRTGSPGSKPQADATQDQETDVTAASTEQSTVPTRATGDSTSDSSEGGTDQKNQVDRNYEEPK